LDDPTPEGPGNRPTPMMLVKCLECGSEQDFEEAVGYCEKCGKKLPVPLRRGKDSVRKKLTNERPPAEVGATNIFVTAILAIGVLAGIITLATLVIRNQL
jgi:hypothetical protein